jgi:CRP-like cAMP-binding protein
MTSSDKPNLQLFVDRLTSRSLLTDAEKQAILNLPFRAGQVQSDRDFVKLGEKVDHCCFVVAGLVGRFDQNANGARQITAIHIPGDMPDLHSLVQPTATSALQSLSVSTILRIPHSAVRDAIKNHPPLAETLWRDCMVDAAILAQWVVNLGRRDARSLIAHLLCEMAVRLQAATEAGAFSFPFHVTQAQLADATGLTVVHVNRVLRALRESGLAEASNHTMKVLNWGGLVATGDFDSDYLQTNIQASDRLRIVPSC